MSLISGKSGNPSNAVSVAMVGKSTELLYELNCCSSSADKQHPTQCSECILNMHAIY